MISILFGLVAVLMSTEGSALAPPGCWVGTETRYHRVKSFSEPVVSIEGKHGAKGVLPS